MLDILSVLKKVKSLEDFENWLYYNPQAQKLLGTLEYQLLLEFNYKDVDAVFKFDQLLKQNILSNKDYFSYKLYESLCDSGWFKERRIKISNNYIGFYPENAIRILRNYGGLTIEKANHVYREIEFLKDLKRIESRYVLFAMTENTYVGILMDHKECFYYFFDVTSEIKYAGSNLEEVLAQLLFIENPW